VKNDYVIINNKKYSVTYAVTEAEQMQGLMYLEANVPNMVFPQKKAKVQKFWMKDTKVPLDIIFCRDNKIIHIAFGRPMCLDLLGPESPSDLIIEFPTGVVKENKINIGDKINLKYSIQTISKILKNSYNL